MLPIAASRELASQNRWPSLRRDMSSLLGLGGNLLGAGFYYKTFMWPSWHAYEGMIRRLAGFGPRAAVAALCRRHVLEHSSCDVLIAGGGPAGLAAALAASEAGATVVVCEREPRVRRRA